MLLTPVTEKKKFKPDFSRNAAISSKETIKFEFTSMRLCCSSQRTSRFFHIYSPYHLMLTSLILN